MNIFLYFRKVNNYFCPDLEASRELFDVLKPEEFGIELSETFQIHPEQSTSALVVHHPKASYYAV